MRPRCPFCAHPSGKKGWHNASTPYRHPSDPERNGWRHKIFVGEQSMEVPCCMRWYETPRAVVWGYAIAALLVAAIVWRILE